MHARTQTPSAPIKKTRPVLTTSLSCRSQSPARSDFSSIGDVDDDNSDASVAGLDFDEEEGYDLNFLLG